MYPYPILKECIKSKNHYFFSESEQKRRFEDAFSFAFVRHPIERLVSCFLDKFYKSHYSGYKDLRDKIMSSHPSKSNVTTEPDEELEKRLKAAEEKDDKVREKAEFFGRFVDYFLANSKEFGK